MRNTAKILTAATLALAASTFAAPADEASYQAALADIENVAAEAAQEMVARLAGVTVNKADAAKAVKAAMVHG